MLIGQRYRHDAYDKSSPQEEGCQFKNFFLEYTHSGQLKMQMRAAKPSPQGKEGPRSVALREEGAVYESWESAYSAEAVIVFKIIKNITVPISSQFPPFLPLRYAAGPFLPLRGRLCFAHPFRFVDR